MDPSPSLLPVEQVTSRIFLLRGEKVLLDSDLAELYGVPTKVLNQAVQRNVERFPSDFVFQLSEIEMDAVLRSQVVTSKAKTEDNSLDDNDILRSQVVTSKEKKGGRRYLPFAFTEQGVAMLSSVLRSPRAVAVNIEIMRAFVRLRQMIGSHTDLARKVTALEKKYDEQFKVVFDAIRELMTPPEVPAGEMGFHTGIPALRRKPAKTKKTKRSA